MKTHPFDMTEYFLYYYKIYFYHKDKQKLSNEIMKV